ncbi:spore germination protein [Paenibacillus selenitireducens]|uniref:Spore germination protein n=1 Tax=Paenibacillus selenitireducens TaxID=1324314 RepID=A0A1T2XKY6_9BACL|nr:spore germination protein [Paenibacillus selenitireducens]OPA80386.1 spore germination protein [Paenibacillus selenitireducens]
MSNQPNTPVLSTSVKDNINNFRCVLGSPNDLQVKEITLGNAHPCGVVGIEGLTNKDIIQDQVLRSLMISLTDSNKNIPVSGEELLLFVQSEVLPLQAIDVISDFDEAIRCILAGDTALFVEGADKVLMLSTKGWKSRGIEEPQTEGLIRGPRDGFTEDLGTTTALVRRKVQDPHLRFDTYKIGNRMKKDVIVAYIDDLANPKLVQEVKRRLVTLHKDDVDGSGLIEQWISDNYLSPFPQILSTERPDKVAAALLQGRVAILVDGTPFQLIMPITFATSLHSPEDNYQNWMISSVIRLLRIGAAFMATFLPAIYIALTEFHHGMLPSMLAFSIAGAREGVPFPAVVEAFIMEITLELLREAGIRLPKPIGQTIGIVGGLVIGEAAVSAGIVSPIMVIIVAITAISSFALPSYSTAISLRLLRFGIMIAAAVFGLYGIVLAFITIMIHMVNLRSFGLPYSTPFAPTFFKDITNTAIRTPVSHLEMEPEMLKSGDHQQNHNRKR